MRTRLLLIGFVLALVPALAGAQVGSGERRVGDSEDPTIASVLISQDAFPADGSAIGAVVATSQAFADALAGSALAGTIRPILFTDGGDAPLRDEVLTEIQRVVGPAQGCAELTPSEFEVAILGGEAAVSADAEAAITDAGYCAVRFAGVGREQTALEIAEGLLLGEQAFAGAGARILVARRDNFADAATGGALAAFAGLPLVVTPTDLLHPDVASFLQDNADRIDEAIVLGGPAAISQEVAQQIGDLVGTVTRVSGPTRDGTAAAIASQLWPADIDTATLVNGFTDVAFVYAIAAGPLSALERAPQLYTQRDQLTQPTIDYLAAAEGGFAQGGQGITQILSGPESQISFAPGEGFDGSAVISSGMPMAASVSRGPAEVSTVFYPDVSAPGADITSSQVSVVPNGGPAVWSPDHRHIYVPTLGDVPTVEMVDPATGTQQTLFSGQPGEEYFNAVPSPNGQRVAIDSIRNGIGGVSIINVGSDSATVEVDFYQHEGQDTFLGSHQVWSPDSGSVVVNTHSDDPVVAVVGVDGTTTEIGPGFSAASNPSADQIARTNFETVTVTNRSGELLGQLPFGSATLPIFSGDGQTLLVSDDGTATTCSTPPTSEDDCTTHPADTSFFGSASISTNGDFIAAVTNVGGQSGFMVQNTSNPSATVTVTFDGTGQVTAFGPALPNYCPIPGDEPSLVNTQAFATCP